MATQTRRVIRQSPCFSWATVTAGLPNYSPQYMHDKEADTMLGAYECKLLPVRIAFDTNPAIRRLLGPDLPAEVLLGFLLHFSALGIGMTEPVEGWIERAGRCCGEMGLAKLSAALIAHARHEAGHHVMMIDDTKRLVDQWNARSSLKLDADTLFALGPTPAVRAYQHLHEEVISGPSPYGQLAIEYEIEMLSVRIGPLLVQQCRDLLGDEILSSMSFIDDHVKLDQGHTQFNRRQLGHVLGVHPDFLEPLVHAGTLALHAYGDFLAECLCKGRELVEVA